MALRVGLAHSAPPRARTSVHSSAPKAASERLVYLRRLRPIRVVHTAFIRLVRCPRAIVSTAVLLSAVTERVVSCASSLHRRHLVVRSSPTVEADRSEITGVLDRHTLACQSLLLLAAPTLALDEVARARVVAVEDVTSRVRVVRVCVVALWILLAPHQVYVHELRVVLARRRGLPCLISRRRRRWAAIFRAGPLAGNFRGSNLNNLTKGPWVLMVLLFLCFDLTL